MKKALILGLALALVGGAAYANFCARDFVPAATLLVPYGVVALSPLTNQPDPNGYTTILDVINVSNTKQLIHVVLWDPLSVHIVDFDEVLSGYDVWQINFRDLLNGAFNLFDTGAVTDGSGRISQDDGVACRGHGAQVDALDLGHVAVIGDKVPVKLAVQVREGERLEQVGGVVVRRLAVERDLLAG